MERILADEGHLETLTDDDLLAEIAARKATHTRLHNEVVQVGWDLDRAFGELRRRGPRAAERVGP